MSLLLLSACRLLEVSPPKGSVPVLKDLAADKWVADSAAIVDLLEERFPRPPMGKSDAGPDVCVPGLQAPSDASSQSICVQRHHGEGCANAPPSCSNTTALQHLAPHAATRSCMW